MLKIFVIKNFLLFITNRPKILSKRKTISYILKNHCSFSRFGDGELVYMIGNDMAFEKYDIENSKTLLGAFKTKDQRVLICLNEAFGYGLKHYKKMTKNHYKDLILSYYSSFYKLFDKKYIYGNASITRFYMDYKNNKKILLDQINLLKKLWSGKKLLVVEGSDTKMGVGNDLFSSAKSIRRIICPNKGCMSLINRISNSIINNVTKDEVVLMALGAAASLLCVELPIKYNITCYDVGHIDIEYTWYINKVKDKTLIIGKHSAEAKPDSPQIELKYDANYYESQIIDYI